MSTKEQILKLASDPSRGKEISEQMVSASKHELSEVVIKVNGQKEIKLVRIAEISK